MKPKAAWLAWALCGVVCLASLINLWNNLVNAAPSAGLFGGIVQSLFVVLIMVSFAVVGALIVSRQPRNLIGWLLFMPAIVGILDVGPYIRSFSSLPAQPPLRLILSVWYNTVVWLLLIFPLFFIPVLFPTGRPPSPRWRWLIIAGLGMCAVFIFLATFQRSFSGSDLGMDWSLTNPIGFIPVDEFEGAFLAIWGLGLLAMAALSVTSLFLRYRGADLVEREQIKWLLYACALFSVAYMVTLPINMTQTETALNELATFLIYLSLIGIPASIAIAILRYRLWDIDVIVRKTLVYGALTAMLGIVFFGGVALLQGIFGGLTGTENSPVAIVLSTLAIAALFNTLRKRVQDFIDRRFYRKKYNAEQALARFAATARGQTDIEQLSAELQAVVQETMQPEGVSLWLRKGQPKG